MSFQVEEPVGIVVYVLEPTLVATPTKPLIESERK